MARSSGTCSAVQGKQVRSASRTAAPKAARVVAVTAASRPVWFPGSPPAEHLDGSAPGDYGFDPLGLSKFAHPNQKTLLT